MKNIYFVFLFLLLATSLYAQRAPLLNDGFYTSEGLYSFIMYYEGNYRGQEIAEQQALNPNSYRIPSITNGQTETINNALSRYQNNTGYTYLFFLILRNNPTGKNIAVAVIVEMTSSRNWKYWAYSMGNLY